MSGETDNNAWAEKARTLDRYRWLLLRERHGPLGSALRFLRDAITDFAFGLSARRRLADSVVTEPCDFLLLQSAPKVIAFQRKKQFIGKLRERDHLLVEIALQTPAMIRRQRLLKRPSRPVPLRYYGYAAHAEWLVARYAPRILLNDRNGSLYTPFLRLALNARRGLLVQLAHASTVEDSRRLGMNDYDFYFLFGQSSLDALRSRKLLFGDSTVVLAGSHMVGQEYAMRPADPALRSVLVLGVGPDKEKESGYQRTYALLRDWARQHPEYQLLVKRHPRSRAPFWLDVAASEANVQVLPSETTLAQALEQCSLVVNIMSNAVIEAGLAERPVLYCYLGEGREIFAQARFFGPSVKNVDEMHRRVLQIEQNYAPSVEHARAFAHFHLAHGARGMEMTVQALECLLNQAALPENIHTCRQNRTL